jgi:hypothetical protein
LDKLKDFREQAQVCRRLAAQTRNTDYRTQLIALAHRWDAVADEREKLLEARNRLKELNQHWN